MAAAAAAVSVPALAAVSPPVLKWQRGGCSAGGCQTGWYSSPAVADLDGDGQPEVIWGSYDLVVVQGSTGTLRARATNGQRVWPGVAVADLTGDGSLEIVVGRGGNQVHAYRFVAPGTLQVVWSTAAAFPAGGEVRTLAVEDLETDGQLEVVAGRASGGSFEQVNVFTASGTVRSGWPARRNGEAGYGWGMYNENVAVADMNGDGFKEIFAPTDTHYITALDRNGNQLPVNPIYTGRSVWSQVGVHVDQAADLVRLRGLRRPASAQLREQRSGGGRRGRRRHQGAGGHRRRLQLRDRRSRRRPLPPALHPEARPYPLVGQRLTTGR